MRVRINGQSRLSVGPNLYGHTRLGLYPAPLKSQAQITSLLNKSASNKRDCPEDSPWDV